MSDSREVYESKPNIVIPLFIYTILGMLLTAIIWMCFGHIDVVVKSEGMIRPNNQVGTIVNTFGGTLSEVQVSDGNYVQEGDILYIVEHKEIITELQHYKELLAETNENIELLQIYKQSIDEGINHFKKKGKEEEYYLKFQSYLINYELTKKNTSYQDQERGLKLNGTISDLNNLETELKLTQKLKVSINQNKNLFSKTGEEREYYNLYQKYINDYTSISGQYNKAKLEIDTSTTEEGLQDALAYQTEMLEGLELLQNSIEEDENYFEDINTYSLQYEEYTNQVKKLEETYKQAKENYEINQLLKGLAVTEWEVEQSKLTMEEAKRTLETYQVNFLGSIMSKISELEKNLKELNLAKDNTKSKEFLYELNSNEKELAIENYQLKYMIELDSKITSLEVNLESLKRNKSSLELQGETRYYVESEDGQAGDLVEYRNREIRTNMEAIDSYAINKKELEIKIEKLNKQVESAIVKATKSGMVNMNYELVEGNVLSSGLEVMTIIPAEDTKFKVNIYINNGDIGKLKEGMDVKFNIYALPNRDYGYVTGTITKISKDLKVDRENTAGYYLAEASINSTVLYDEKGQEIALKPGMACQAQMITENKSILQYVLEKIDLWIN